MLIYYREVFLQILPGISQSWKALLLSKFLISFNTLQKNAMVMVSLVKNFSSSFENFTNYITIILSIYTHVYDVCQLSKMQFSLYIMKYVFRIMNADSKSSKWVLRNSLFCWKLLQFFSDHRTHYHFHLAFDFVFFTFLCFWQNWRFCSTKIVLYPITILSLTRLKAVKPLWGME